MDQLPKPRVPKRIFLAMVISIITLPLPLALSKGNCFHDFTIYDRHWFVFFFAYIIGTAGVVWLGGSAHIAINDWPNKYRGKNLVWLTYFISACCFFSMHILKLFYRETFDYLKSLL